MTNQEKFRLLQEQYTIEELADAVMVPEELSEAELAVANVELAYRLEKHSGGLIKAEHWWRLSILKQEYFIKQDTVGRSWEGEKGVANLVGG